MNLSKSRYVQGVRCPKLLWLSCYKSWEATEQNNDNTLENGNEVGDLARHLFGDNYLLIEYNNDKKIMIDETNKLLKEKNNIICEASFSYDGNFCSVDLLKNYVDGVEIYEVKSSTGINTSYIRDISYQTWLLKKCGLNVKKSYIVYVNNKYIKNGNIELDKYFVIKDVSDLINLDEVEKNVSILKKIINKDIEPSIDISMSCKKNKDNPFDCPFFNYCTKDLPKPNVFDVGWHARFDKKLDYYYKAIITYPDLLKKGGFNSKANLQMEYTIHNLKPKINKENIKKLFDTFSYPLYFLDFESYQEAIPTIDGTHPYEQICFQYSLHYYLQENGKLYHKEYLCDDYNSNPMYGLCKRLCEDIPIDSCILVYNDKFEIPRLKEMANIFPEFRDYLLNIADHIIDILPPFENQDYYTKEMEGSASIKKVLPALFPNDPTLDYHNLEQVHKGDEASNAYLSLKNLDKSEEQRLRDNMLKYCCLDTYAMVKIYDKLKSVINEKDANG